MNYDCFRANLLLSETVDLRAVGMSDVLMSTFLQNKNRKKLEIVGRSRRRRRTDGARWHSRLFYTATLSAKHVAVHDAAASLRSPARFGWQGLRVAEHSYSPGRINKSVLAMVTLLSDSRTQTQ